MSILTIRLDSKASERLYRQIYEQIRSEIVTGRLPPDGKLPSVRQLSRHLQCSQNTVKTAYSQLYAEGYITPRPKSGYYVGKIEGLLHIKKDAAYSPGKEPKRPVCKYDFSYQGVDLDSFPFSTWRKINREVINEYDPELLTLGDPQGDFRLRSGIADYLRNSRGVECKPGQIVISSGTEYLLQLLIQLFHKECVYAIENPGYEKINLIFKSNRVTYRPIPLDRNGMIPDRLTESNADIACITPSHQFPTGGIMPISRRIQLLNWANETKNRYLIEDDYDSEFKYRGKPIPSLQGLDKGEKVIYMGAFSKSLTPAIRISYMVLPEPLRKIYSEKLAFYICPVPTIEQKVLSRFIDEGHFERHLNRMRKIYREKREILVSSIKRLLPTAEIEGANAGLHLILYLNNGMNERELADSAEKNGIRVFGCSQYYFDREISGRRPALLLGFAALRKEEIPEAVEALRDIWYLT